MRLSNKFFWIKIAVVGISAFTVATDASRFMGVQTSPSVNIASRVAPTVKDGIIQGGNYLWNSEIRQENKDFYGVNFEKKEDDFEEVDYITKTQETIKLEKMLEERLYELEENE